MTPNVFAYCALLSWPLVALYLFYKRPIGQAILWTVLGAYLFLPPRMAIKFQMVPALDKSSIPNICAFIGCILVTRKLPKLFSRFGITEILILMFLVGPFISSDLNGDAIAIGPVILPGVGWYDAGSAVIGEFLFFLPFILGRQYLRSGANIAEILRALVLAGLVYSLPILFEVRMSPQLNTWIYGYFPSSFAQQVRDGGFRPVVFLGHGLLIAFFAATAAIAAAALWRERVRVVRVPAAGAAAYLSVVLVLCKTLGALLYGAVLVPVVRWASPRAQFRVAMVLVAIALTYPLLRTMDLVPTTSMVDAAASISADRAESLQFRFDNEDELLRHASDRLWFGWGRFGRNRVYSKMGRDVSVTDGEWIIRLGIFGLVGFLAEFGLLALSVVRAASALRFSESRRDSVFLSTTALIVAVNLIDLLPNSSISPWSWLLAGALLGRAERLLAEGRRLPPSSLGGPITIGKQ